MAGFVAGAAAAQSATATDQSGKPYLAGLHPPLEPQKPAHATSHVSAQRNATTKIAQPESKRRPMVGANSKSHRPAHLAEKINSRVAWPSAEPPATDEQATSQTVLQFATEDTEPAPAAASRRTIPDSTPSPAKIAATDERNRSQLLSTGRRQAQAHLRRPSGLKPRHRARCASSCRHPSRPPPSHQHLKIGRRRKAAPRPLRCRQRLPAQSLPASSAG